MYTTLEISVREGLQSRPLDIGGEEKQGEGEQVEEGDSPFTLQLQVG